MNLQYIRTGIVCLLFIAGIFRASNANERIDVLAVEYPPFTSSSMPGNGISFEHLQAEVGNTLDQHTYHPIFAPPGRAERLLAKGLYCMSFFPPREFLDDYKFHSLEEPNIELALVRKRMSESFEWKDLTELSGKSVAVLRTEGEGIRHKKMIQSGLKPIYILSVSALASTGVYFLNRDLK